MKCQSYEKKSRALFSNVSFYVHVNCPSSCDSRLGLPKDDTFIFCPFNPIALRIVKILWNFGCFECNRIKRETGRVVEVCGRLISVITSA